MADPTPPADDVLIEDAELSIRLINILARAEIRTFGEARAISAADFLRLPSANQRCLDELAAALRGEVAVMKSRVPLPVPQRWWLVPSVLGSTTRLLVLCAECLVPARRTRLPLPAGDARRLNVVCSACGKPSGQPVESAR